MYKSIRIVFRSSYLELETFFEIFGTPSPYKNEKRNKGGHNKPIKKSYSYKMITLFFL